MHVAILPSLEQSYWTSGQSLQEDNSKLEEAKIFSFEGKALANANQNKWNTFEAYTDDITKWRRCLNG